MSKTIAKFMIKKFLKVDGKSTSLGHQPAYKYGKKWKGNWNDKPLPPYLTQREAKNLKRVMNFAHTLDGSLVSFGPFKMGWGVVYGLFPVIGDFLDAILAAIIVLIIMRIVPWRDEKKQPDHRKLSSGMLAFMWIQVFALFAIGIVPVAGDIIDSLLQCNKRNAKMIYNHLQKLSDSRGPHWVEVKRNGKEKMTQIQHDRGNMLGIQMTEEPGRTGFPHPEMGQRTESHRTEKAPGREFSHHTEDTRYAADTGHIVNVQHADTQRPPYNYRTESSPSPAVTSETPRSINTWQDLKEKMKQVGENKQRQRSQEQGVSPLQGYTPSPRSNVVSPVVPELTRAATQRSNSGGRRNMFGGSRERERDLERGEEVYQTPPSRPGDNWI